MESEERVNRDGAVKVTQRRLHLDENIEVTVRPRVAPRVTAKQNDPSRIAMLHDRPGDRFDQSFFNVSQ